jgi:ribose transport system substrate-binding protein
LAVQWAVALATGGEKPKEQIFEAPAYEDSVSGKPNAVQCRKDLPGAIYMSSALKPEDQAKAVGQ